MFEVVLNEDERNLVFDVLEMSKAGLHALVHLSLSSSSLRLLLLPRLRRKDVFFSDYVTSLGYCESFDVIEWALGYWKEKERGKKVVKDEGKAKETEKNGGEEGGGGVGLSEVGGEREEGEGGGEPIEVRSYVHGLFESGNLPLLKILFDNGLPPEYLSETHPKLFSRIQFMLQTMNPKLGKKFRDPILTVFGPTAAAAGQVKVLQNFRGMCSKLYCCSEVFVSSGKSGDFECIQYIDCFHFIHSSP